MRWLLVAVAIAAPCVAYANVGRSSFPGSHNAEPSGLKSVAIAHEDLTFDLRPLIDRSPPHVSATYQLVSASEATLHESLVFVTGAQRADATVTFDGKPVAVEMKFQRVEVTNPSWAPPRTTPAIDGEREHDYETEESAVFAFTLDIPPGEHRLVVAYMPTPQLDRSRDGGTIVWQVGYVLSPARDWGGYGGLDVKVDVPAGWRAAVSPKLTRTGDTLHGTFTSLPADTIGITVQAPTGTLHDVIVVGAQILFLLCLIGGPVLIVLRARRRRGALAFVLVWAASIVVMGTFCALSSDVALPPQQSALYGYGGVVFTFLAFCAGILALPIGWLIVKLSRPRDVL